jgi:peptidyl-Asp metalloendopeptidase
MLHHAMSSRLFDCRWVVVWLALWALVGVPSRVMAQTPELVTAIPSNQLTDATPAQTAAIDRLRQRPTTQALSLVTVNIDALHRDTIRLGIPSMPTLTLSRGNEEFRSPTDFTWHGTLSGVPGQATLVVHDGNITGSIQDQYSLYRIEPIGNGVHALIKVDSGRFPPEHPPSFQERERRGDARPPTATRDATSDAPVGIDVMVPYTTAAKNAVADIAATIQLAVAEANQSYTNSGIHIKLNLVDSFEVVYSETGKTFDTILADFVANSTVQSRRTSSGADLSAMIIDQSDFCGLADAILATPSTAFAVVYYDCATGYYSFAHELGHLMGARHDENHDSTTTPYAYGHGYEHPSSVSGQSFRTIMAYACDAPSSCDPRIQYWSSPNVKYIGTATGTSATNDNVRVLNATAGTVAAFNSPPGTGRSIAPVLYFLLGQGDTTRPSITPILDVLFR